MSTYISSDLPWHHRKCHWVPHEAAIATETIASLLSIADHHDPKHLNIPISCGLKNGKVQKSEDVKSVWWKKKLWFLFVNTYWNIWYHINHISDMHVHRELLQCDFGWLSQLFNRISDRTLFFQWSIGNDLVVLNERCSLRKRRCSKRCFHDAQWTADLELPLCFSCLDWPKKNFRKQNTKETTNRWNHSDTEVIDKNLNFVKRSTPLNASIMQQFKCLYIAAGKISKDSNLWKLKVIVCRCRGCSLVKETKTSVLEDWRFTIAFLMLIFVKASLGQNPCTITLLPVKTPYQFVFQSSNEKNKLIIPNTFHNTTKTMVKLPTSAAGSHTHGTLQAAFIPTGSHRPRPRPSDSSYDLLGGWNHPQCWDGSSQQHSKDIALPKGEKIFEKKRMKLKKTV